MVYGHIARLQIDIDRALPIKPLFIHCRTQHVGHVAPGDELGKFIPVTPWDHPHATVFLRRLIDREPKRDYFHRLQGPLASVLMPKHRMAVIGRLADVV